MVNSIWGTLLSVNENVYLANALEDRSKSVTVIALTGFIGLIFTIAASIALPQMITSMGTERSGWTLIAIILAIPFTLFGLLRFLLVKEVKDSGENAAAHITLKEAFFLLIKNKYIMLYCALLLLANLGQNLSVATYYYTVVMGDLSLASVMSMSMLVTVVVIIIAPIVSKKFGLTNLIKVCTLIGAVGFLLKLLDLSNVGLLFASTLLSSLGFVPMYAFAGTFVIDCMDYGEWKYKKRSEGVLNCTTGVASKIGTAFGAGLMGILMGIAGYNGMAEVQTQSASHMIIALNTVIPAVFCIILFVLLRFYDLDKKIVKIREDLKR
jgi:Na+/melibiose symporter-like transporter